MLLKRAVIQHYKSLDEVRVDFTPITVLVGPNGVGKSNFVDALRFFRDIVKDGLDHAVIAREGIDRIRQKYKSRPYDISLALDFESAPGSGKGADYHLTLAGKGGEYAVKRENASYLVEEVVHTDEHGLVDVSDRHYFSRQKDQPLTIDGRPFEHKMRDDVAALGSLVVEFDLLGLPIVDDVRQWSFCAPYPNTLRKLSPPDKEDGLREDGSNWATVVRALKRTARGKEALERIAEVMRIAVPGYQDISVSTAGSYLVPQLTLAGNEKFDPVQLSDGTLRVFGILLALYQDPAPPLLVIEEPEQTIHPGVLPALAEAFKEASERTQILVTTHSPQLVDQFEPECVRVVSSEGGLTRISPIKASQVEAVKERLMSLQEFMSAEGLLPEGPGQ